LPEFNDVPTGEHDIFETEEAQAQVRENEIEGQEMEILTGDLKQWPKPSFTKAEVS
jgi:hypothetical protein